MAAKRRPLGKPLPVTKDGDDTTPTAEQIDRSIASWDSVVPEKWRGMLEPKPVGWVGTPKPRYFYDDLRGMLLHANGQVVTAAEKRAAMLAYQAGIK